MPQLVAKLLQQILSVKRIAAFLKHPDVEYLDNSVHECQTSSEITSVYIQGTVCWYQSQRFLQDSSAFQLSGLDLNFPPGKLSLIAGKFGAGKTLLLLSLLGETSLVAGKISYLVSPVLDPLADNAGDWSVLASSVAYVPQVGIIPIPLTSC